MNKVEHASNWLKLKKVQEIRWFDNCGSNLSYCSRTINCKHIVWNDIFLNVHLILTETAMGHKRMGENDDGFKYAMAVMK